MPLNNDEMEFEDCPPARNSLMTNHGEDVEALIIAVSRPSSRKTTESNMITESEEQYSDEEEEFAFAGGCYSKVDTKGGQSNGSTAPSNDELLEAMAEELENSGQSHLLAFVS